MAAAFTVLGPDPISAKVSRLRSQACLDSWYIFIHIFMISHIVARHSHRTNQAIKDLHFCIPWIKEGRVQLSKQKTSHDTFYSHQDILPSFQLPLWNNMSLICTVPHSLVLHRRPRSPEIAPHITETPISSPV